MTYKERRPALRKKLLGVSMGTAQRRLMRKLLFREVAAAGKNECYRCGKAMAEDNYSIEHTRKYSNYDEFMDLNHILYSHQICNVKAH